MFCSVNIVLVEYESSAMPAYKNTGRKDQERVLHQGRTPRMSLLSTSEGKRGAEEETGRRGEDARERLKGAALAEVIGIPRQSACWL